MERFCHIRSQLVTADNMLKQIIDNTTFIPDAFRKLYLINAERMISVMCGRMHEFNTALPSEIELKLLGYHLHFACMAVQHAVENTAEEVLFIPGIKALVDVIDQYAFVY